MVSQDALSAGQGRLVTLTTDFGLADAYVAAMKAVILSQAPGCQIVDICHLIAPRAVLEGAILFELAWSLFPPGTVHVVVIDPGVGTGRRRLALATAGHFFVGPDNGCLSAALAPATRARRAAGEPYEARTVRLPDDVMAVSIENDALLRRPVSATFEGRDVFAPVAAFLAGGGVPGDLGPRVDGMQAFPDLRAPPMGTGLDGCVLHVDRFGSLITDVRAADLQGQPVFGVAGHKLTLARTYGEAGGLTAIVGSAGLVEVALPNASAAQVLGVGAGDRVSVSW